MHCTVYYGICTPFLSPTMGFLSELPVPTVEDLQLFQNKMTNAQTNALGWGVGGWVCLELTEPYRITNVLGLE